MAMDESKQKFIGVVAIGTVVIFIALVCTSYTDLQYYEIGFLRSETTGAVDTTTVFTGGRYWPGPTYDFKSFDATIHIIELDDVTVFASVDKLEIELDVSIGYFLIPDYLHLLHDEYDLNYHSLMISSATAAIKDSANTFKLTQFYEEREEVELAIHHELQQRLSGKCCPDDCTLSLCLGDCLLNCNDSDKGLFVDVRYFQLTDIKIPDKVEQRNLKALVLTEQTDKATYVQESSVITKETEKMVDAVKNEAAEVTANATAIAKLIEAKSQANYQKILEDARRAGLELLFNSIGLNETSHKNSFDYLRSLADLNSAHLTVGFDQIIMASKDLVP